MRDAFISTLLKESRMNPNIEVILGDLGFKIFDEYREEFPNRIFDGGIQEQNMIGVAAGLTMTGRTVVTYSIANFQALRALEQIRNDCCYNNRNVKIVSSGAGYVYGSLGMSHHQTEDISVLRAIPNITILSPCDKYESESCTRAMLNTDGTFYLRIGRGGEECLHTASIKDFKIGDCYKIYEGSKDIVIFTTGAISSYAYHIAKELDISLYTFPTIKPLNKEQIIEISNKYKTIVTLEENNVCGGFGSAISELLIGLDKHPKVIILGIPDCYQSITGHREYLLDRVELSENKLMERIKKEL